jgi:phosphoglycolate phosphatase
MAEKVLSHVGIKDYFDCIIGAAREKKDSSKASLIEKAIEASGQTDISQFIMIGDTRYDIDAAVTVGIDSIGAAYGYGTYEEIKEAGATYIADTPADILKYTCGLGYNNSIRHFRRYKS